jgi:hypothetical protein
MLTSVISQQYSEPLEQTVAILPFFLWEYILSETAKTFTYLFKLQIFTTKQVGLEVMLYTCVPEMLSLNLGWDTSYPDWGFVLVFLSPSRHMLGLYPNYAMNSSFQILSSLSVILPSGAA